MKFRSLVLSAAVAAASLWPVAVAPAACAGEAPRAALVVDTGESVLNLCVALPDGSVSGIELIKLASSQHGLSYKLGFGGAAVCNLAGVGPTGDDCFEQDPDFWGYWHGDGSGGWTWASTEAGSTTVTDGSVEGWAWGSGTGPGTHPAPPATRFADVCAPVKSGDKKDGEPTAGKPRAAPRSTPAPTATVGSSDGPQDNSEQSGQERGAKKKKLAKPRPQPSPEPTSTPAAVATPTPGATTLGPSELASDSGGGGPPAAGIAALVGTLFLLGGGAFAARRRASR